MKSIDKITPNNLEILRHSRSVFQHEENMKALDDIKDEIKCELLSEISEFEQDKSLHSAKFENSPLFGGFFTRLKLKTKLGKEDYSKFLLKERDEVTIKKQINLKKYNLLKTIYEKGSEKYEEFKSFHGCRGGALLGAEAELYHASKQQAYTQLYQLTRKYEKIQELLNDKNPIQKAFDSIKEHTNFNKYKNQNNEETKSNELFLTKKDLSGKGKYFTGMFGDSYERNNLRIYLMKRANANISESLQAEKDLLLLNNSPIDEDVDIVKSLIKKYS